MQSDYRNQSAFFTFIKMLMLFHRRYYHENDNIIFTPATNGGVAVS